MKIIGAYVLLSGGIDSTSVLAMAVRDYGAENVFAILFDYGQRHQKENTIACHIAEHLNVLPILLDIKSIMARGGLTNPDLEIPQKTYAELPEGVSPTYVPNRNAIMLSIAAGLASTHTFGSDTTDGPEGVLLMYGAHKEDAENDAYPDCSERFVTTLREALLIATYGRVHMKAPFVRSTKAQVIRSGLNANAPLHLTWSCYEGGELHCGKCPTCLARKQAFIDAQHTDPTHYEGEEAPDLNEQGHVVVEEVAPQDQDVGTEDNGNENATKTIGSMEAK